MFCLTEVGGGGGGRVAEAFDRQVDIFEFVSFVARNQDRLRMERTGI